MRKHLNKFQYAIWVILGSFLSISEAFAQRGLSAINQATTMVTSYFDPASKLMLAVGALIGLIGGVKVYKKLQSGDPEAGSIAASWFGACIFLVLVAVILRAFFL